MKRTLALLLFGAMAIGVAAHAQQTTTRTTARRSRSTANADVAAQLEQMRTMLQQQQQEIEQLRQQLAARDQAVQSAQQQATEAQSAATQAAGKADAAATQAASAQQNLTALQTDVNDVKANATTTALNIQENQAKANESPIAIHYKGITLTPGGFLAAESVWRQHGLAADVNTPFNSIPFAGSDQSRLSEWFGSGRQSRISLLGEGKLGAAKLTGYYETDWLSAGVTSNNNQSNSYTNRQRQIWGQASLSSGWAFTGGQMWSLVTETKNGLDNRTELLPMTIDAQYHVGFSWARQFGFRVTKNFNNKMWFGVSLENPQTTFAAHGNASNFFFGAAGNGGGLYNATANYSFNRAPDIIGKLAFQPGWGHYEVFGIVSQFRDRIYPNASATPASASGAFTYNTTGGGIGANARGTIAKHIDIGFHALGGDGVGRYGTTSLPDATVRPDGTLSLIRSYQGLFTLEWHSPKWDIYSNVGAEYAGRKYLANAKGADVGYGAPSFNNSGCMTEVVPGGGNGFTPGSAANCNGDTRNIIEGTIGFWYRFYNGPKGRVQWGPQLSYVDRNTWRGTGRAPNAIEPMVFTSLRYYLP
jgi:hypothetical protein